MSVPFITINAPNEKGDTQFSVTNEARAFLESLHQKVTITSCTGPYRGGKSYLLSRLTQSADTFPKSASTQPHTRGLHLSTNLIAGEHLFIDTEGFGSCVSGNMQTDVAIFALAILLSSKVIFNSSGKVDANTLDILECAVEAAAKLSCATENQDALKDSNSKPHLLYLIRNMSLNLQDENKKAITPIQYLEDCISKYSRGKELTQALNLLFCERTCITMCTPCHDKDMAEMKNLYPAFEQDYSRVESNVFGRTVSKKIAGCEMNGPVILALADSLCAALSKGGIIKLDGIMATAKAAAVAEMRFKNVTDFTTTLHSKFSPQPKIFFWTVETLYANILDGLKKWKQQQQSNVTAVVVVDNSFDHFLALLDAYFQTALSANALKMQIWKDEIKSEMNLVVSSSTSNDAPGPITTTTTNNNNRHDNFDISHLLPSDLDSVFQPLIQKCELLRQQAAQNQELLLQCEDLKHQIEQLQLVCEAGKKTEKLLIEEKTTLEDQLHECTTKLTYANSTLEFAQTNQFQQDEFLECEKNLETAQDEIRRLKCKVDGMESENIQIHQIWNGNCVKLENEIQNHKKTIETLTNTIAKTQQQLSECSQDLKIRTEDCRAYQKKNTELSMERETIYKKQKITEDSYIASGKKVEQLLATKREYTNKIADLEQQLANEQRENRKLSLQNSLNFKRQ